MSSADETIVQAIVTKGLATKAQIAEARKIHADLEAMGLVSRSIPDVLVERGYVRSEDLESLRQEEHTVRGKDQIAGYKLLALLGRGSMGAVYRAKQISLDRIVALKVLDSAMSTDRAFVERFVNEAQAVARLSHTNLISGIDVGEDDGIHYLAMEFADGVTLSRVLRRGGAMDEERVLKVALQMARALEYAHKNNLVHGDVRPENVLITSDGVVKLSDLGVAKRETTATEEGQELHVAPDYLSPEQARGKKDIAPAADLYALGCVMFHMLLGRVPFPGKSHEAIIASHLTAEAPSVRQLDPEISPGTEAIVATLLEKAPDRRVASATDLAQRIDAAQKQLKTLRSRSTPPPAPAQAGSSPAVRRRRRRR